MLPQMCSNVTGDCFCHENAVPDCSDCLLGYYINSDSECQGIKLL